VPIDAGAATRVELAIGYSLQGILAQIAREGLVRDLASRLTADFARNLEQRLSGAAEPGPAQAKSIDGVALLFHQLWKLVRRLTDRTGKR
jgi:carbon-monoxide dehydrogenase small subunit